MKGPSTTVERVAAALFTPESIAYAVNENFMKFCELRGDGKMVRISPALRARRKLSDEVPPPST